MVVISPQDLGFFPFQMAVLYLANGGDPNHLLNGMILQVQGKESRRLRIFKKTNLINHWYVAQLKWKHM